MTDDDRARVAAMFYTDVVAQVSDAALRFLADCHLDAIALHAGTRLADGAMTALEVVRREQARRALADGTGDTGTA